MTTTVYRATSDGYRGAWSCWAVRRSVAKAYLDNPGYGGTEIIEDEIDLDGHVLDLRGESEPMLRLAEEVAAELGVDYCELANEWGGRGLAYVYECWENDRRLRELLPTLYDHIIHDQETYPEGATVVVRLID